GRLGLLDLRRLWPFAVNRRRLLREWCSVHLAPAFGHRRTLLRRLAPDLLAGGVVPSEEPWEALDPPRWVPWPRPDEPAHRRQLTDRSRDRFAGYLENFHHDLRTDRALRRLLRLCRSQGITARLLFMPESQEFQSWYPPRVRQYAADYLGLLSRE